MSLHFTFICPKPKYAQLLYIYPIFSSANECYRDEKAFHVERSFGLMNLFRSICQPSNRVICNDGGGRPSFVQNLYIMYVAKGLFSTEFRP